MTLKLSPKFTRQLVKEPETGMGYQTVDVTFDDGSKLERVNVFNAEEIDLPPAYARKSIRTLTLSKTARP